MGIDSQSEKFITRTASVVNDTAGTYPDKGDLAFILHSDDSGITGQQSDVENWILTTAPTVDHFGMPLANADPVDLGNGWWEVRLQYGESRQQNRRKKPPTVGENKFSFAIQTTAQHIRQSIKVVKKSDASGLDAGTTTNPPAHWKIGNSAPIAEDNNRVNGIDILVPQPTWQEEYIWDTLDQAYRVTAMKIVGKVNDRTFKGALTGEALCTAISGKQAGDSPWTVTYDFMYRTDETVTFTVADGAGGTRDITMTKQGHQVWDFRYEDSFDAAVSDRVKLIKHVLIHEVYQQANFTNLGIGI